MARLTIAHLNHLRLSARSASSAVAFWLVALLAMSLIPTAANAQVNIPVVLELAEEVNSANTEAGQKVKFSVAEAVVYDDKPLIEKGTIAIGTIKTAKKKSTFSDGKLEFQETIITTTVDDHEVVIKLLNTDSESMFRAGAKAVGKTVTAPFRGKKDAILQPGLRVEGVIASVGSEPTESGALEKPTSPNAPQNTDRASTQASQPKSEKKEVSKQTKEIILTTTDLNQGYEIVGVVTQYQQFADFTFSLRKDPLENAIKNGMEKLKESATRLGADAVIGLRIDFANRTEKDEGRVLIYGTAVKLK